MISNIRYHKDMQINYYIKDGRVIASNLHFEDIEVEAPTIPEARARMEMATRNYIDFVLKKAGERYGG